MHNAIIGVMRACCTCMPNRCASARVHACIRIHALRPLHACAHLMHGPTCRASQQSCWHDGAELIRRNRINNSWWDAVCLARCPSLDVGHSLCSCRFATHRCPVHQAGRRNLINFFFRYIFCCFLLVYVYLFIV